MGYLLDTHTLIWMMDGSSNLPTSVGDILTHEEEDLRISPVSFWEISIKRSLKKLDLAHSTDLLWAEAQYQGINLIPIDISHLLNVEKLPHTTKTPSTASSSPKPKQKISPSSPKTSILRRTTSRPTGSNPHGQRSMSFRPNNHTAPTDTTSVYITATT